ncbi:DNA polymerase I [Simiduia agarivorans]|uniref:DNA polymerase I n=1 Tax=Simiduia agarivorans (strain DSM 21679 / JCM 13881 / BCRC 17597 / SA1) TaxID=1117647 RepID=K4KZZ9_SIMAS|nr:DNA polymerase I [Simiduia agarivorans]AFU99502.1 DNA polymerase I [Simiduia agarivorans SA1 = DSM 21679]
MTAPVVLVDGSSYLYRAFHALPPLTNSKGMPTGAVKGVINMIRRLLKDYPGSPVVVVFDAKGKTFRDDMFPDYKAQRPPMPDDLRPQVQPIHDIVRAMGLPLLVEEGVEADDVIGTYCQQATAAGIPVIVSTGDKDMAQLVNEHVTLVNTMTDTVMDPAGVEAKFGLPPSLIIDFLALMGDKVDNIPGVPGVGEKTALGLLQGLGSLDSIYANLDKVKDLSFRGAKTMAAKLEEHKDKAYMSYALATIKLDCDLPEPIQALANGEPDKARLLALFQDMEFKTWVNELEGEGVVAEVSESSHAAEGPDTKGALAREYEIITTEAAFERWLLTLESQPAFAFDTETTSLDYMEAEIVGVSFSVEPGRAAYVPVAHDYMEAPEQLDRNWVLAKLKPLLEAETPRKIGQNLKYDASVLANYQIALNGIGYDTMLESYVLNSTASRHDMDSLAGFYLDETTVKFEDIAGKGAKQLTFNQIALEQAGPYAAEDADITFRLHQALWPQLEAAPSLKSVFEFIELPLLPVLSAVERTGALVDAKRLGEQSVELGERLVTLEREAFELAGQPFNLSSPKQLGEILFDKLGLPVIKKTPKGAPSTAEEVLQELALDYPLPNILMEYRGLAKLKSTYTDKLPQMINPRTGRIHTSYHQAVTATGRLSSTDPNLQNIPIRTEEGRRIRQAFVAPKGYKLVAADYSQIELRIMAHLSDDKGLLDAFAQGLDVHKATAAEVFGVDLDSVTADMRRSAKAINFGLIYGMSAFGLAKQLHLGRNEAQQYIDTYFERYPGVARYMDNTRALAHEQGYVETLFGRRLYLPEINASNKMRQQAAERTAINAPMQGSAADIIKRAMVDVHQWLSGENAPDARIIMQVHDELVLEVAEDQVDALTGELCERMSRAADLKVPLLVEAGVGDNWDQAH